jgi:hypothetical protein
VDKYINNVGVRNIVVIWAGINDMYVNNVSENVAYRGMKAYCEQRRQKGWKVIVCTEINCTNSSINDSRRLAFNSLIRSNWTSFADGICDLGNTSPFNTATSHENTTYYLADGVHLTATGYAIIANTVSVSISALAGSSKTELKSVVLQVYAPADSVQTATGAAQFSIPSGLDGWKISKIAAHCYTNTGQLVEVQVRRSNSAEPSSYNDVLSTVCTVYHAYYDSKSYGDPNSVINPSYSTVYEGYTLAVDVNYPTATTRRGLDIRIDFTR